MSDDPAASGALPEGEPIEQLAALREPASDRFLSHVLDGINQRQTTSRALEMSWWGLTGLLMELVDTLFRALGIREATHGDDR